MVKGLTENEKKILVLTHNRGRIDINGAMLVYRNRQYCNDALKRLNALGYLTMLDYGIYILTLSGKELLGIEQDEKLAKYVKNE